MRKGLKLYKSYPARNNCDMPTKKAMWDVILPRT